MFKLKFFSKNVLIILIISMVFPGCSPGAVEEENYGAAIQAPVEEDPDLVIQAPVEEPEEFPEYETPPPLVQEFSILDDRLFINMPEGTVDSAVQSSLMSAPASEQEETRLIFENNGKQLIIYAYEYFKYSSGSIVNDAELLAGIWGDLYGFELAFSDVIDLGGAEALILTQVDSDTSEKGVFLKCALIRMPDNTLVNASIFVDQNMLDNRQYCQDLADNILNTISLGERYLDISTHKETIWPHEIEILEDYILVLNRGPDFDVYYINKIVEFSDTAQPGMGIYIGANPSGDEAFEGVDANRVPDSILGQTIEWILYELNNSIRMETIFSIPSEDSIMMHIFLTAYDEADLEQLKTMVYSLKSID